MRLPRRVFLAISVLGLMATVPVFADAGGPAAGLLVGGSLVVLLQLWIVGSEFLYLTWIFRGVPNRRLLWWSVAINACSALVGVIWIWFFLQAFLSNAYNRPEGRVMAFMPAAYALSVLIEWLVLYALQRGREDSKGCAALFGHAALFNALSYSGLVAILFWAVRSRL